jgi:hypothetical protein
VGVLDHDVVARRVIAEGDPKAPPRARNSGVEI